MNLIPYRKYIVISNYPKHVVMDKLCDVTAEIKCFRIKNSPYLFEGIITTDYFRINRILEGRNSFAPIILGKFVSDKNDSTLIEIRMRLSIYTMIFLFVIFLFLSSVLTTILSSQITENKFDINSILILFNSLFYDYLRF